jgi:branched-chain amino acid aminotransferase
MAETDLWAWLNGRKVRGRDAVIPLEDRGVQWGDAVYDSIRTYGGQPFQVDFRIDRFFRSMQYARIAAPLSKAALKEATNEIIAANMPLVDKGGDITINYYVSRGSMKITDGLTPAGTVAIFCRPVAFASFAKHYVKGAPAITPATRRTPPECVSPKAKISNKMNHFVAEMEAKAHNPEAYAVMLDLEGNVTEGTGSNFLFVSGGRIKVPDTRLVLSGADMAAVGELAGNLQIGCDEGTYTTYDLYTADEAFLTTNSFGVLPIVSMNGLPIGTGKVGPVTRRLMDAWSEMVGIDFVAQGLAHLPAEERRALEAEWRAMAA